MTEERRSGWNVDSLKEHIDQRLDLLSEEIDRRFDAQEIATKTALTSAGKAVNKAEILATQRADQQNEWRGTVSDLISTTVNRAEFTAQHVALMEKIDALSGRLDRHEGGATNATTTRMGTYYLIAGGAVGISAICAVAVLIITLFIH